MGPGVLYVLLYRDTCVLFTTFLHGHPPIAPSRLAHRSHAVMTSGLGQVLSMVYYELDNSVTGSAGDRIANSKQV